jgi:hypothetical protein
LDYSLNNPRKLFQLPIDLFFLKGCHIGINTDDDNFEASLGMSRKWDAREAGREVAREVIQKLKRPPNFFLLFATIHYEKHGGFQEFLNGIWDVLPEGTPLVGGTVAGFMNNYGCYTRGCTALAVSYPNMDVAVGVGHNTKRNPKKAVDSASNMIGKNPKHNNNAIIEILPTAVIPKIPGVGQKNVILSKKMGNGFLKLLPAMKKLNYGYDRADEILDFLSDRFEDRVIIGGCTMDDNKMLKNYQFYNQKIENNTLLTLNLSMPTKFFTSTITGYKVQDKTFNVDDISNDKHVIKKIDGEGARSALFEKLNLKIEEKDAVYQLYKNAFYYPLGFKKSGIWHACMIGLIYGENLIFANKIEDKTLTLLTVSIENTLTKINDSILKLSEQYPSCVLGFACETFLETLGKDIFEVQNSFKKLKVPFLVPFVAGESIFTPEIGAHHLYESINLLAFGNS